MPLIFLLKLFSNSFKIIFFRLWCRDPVLKQSFGQQTRLSCQRNLTVFYNSVFTNRIGMAASLLLCVAVAHVVLWSLATRCLQIAVEWVRQGCDDEFLWLFFASGLSVFLGISLRKLQNRTFFFFGAKFWTRNELRGCAEKS